MDETTSGWLDQIELADVVLIAEFIVLVVLSFFSGYGVRAFVSDVRRKRPEVAARRSDARRRAKAESRSESTAA
jgi:hypothetical protein